MSNTSHPFLFCLLLTCLLLAPAPAHSGELLRAGFYAAEPAITFFGPLLHLHPQDRVESGKIRKGLRGSFGLQGKVDTQFSPQGEARFYWADPRSGKSDWFTLETLAEGGLLLRTNQGRSTIRLRYLGIRSPAEEAAGIRTRYLAHRGFSFFPPYNSEGIYPANTLPAFRAALEEGYSGFELDVRVTADGHFAVSHDENLGVATNCEGKVHEKTLSELENCYVNGSTLIPEVKALRTPTIAKMSGLGRVFARFAGDTRLERMVVDVKPDTDAHLASAFREAITPFLGRPDFLRKLLVIVHSDSAIRLMREFNPWSEYFLEGDIGTEPLDRGPEFFPEAYGRPRGSHTGVSLNVGLGMYLPPLLGMQAVVDATLFAQAYQYPVLGWTVSTDFELASTRGRLPGLDFLLTDAPMSVLAPLELETARLGK